MAHPNGFEPPTDRTQWALRERVKELTCLYGIAQVADRSDVPTEEAVSRVASLLPPAWQYPECAVARVVLDGREFRSPGLGPSVASQEAPIIVSGRNRGCVEVGYCRERPAFDEGPFLHEERSLINEVARQVAFLVERREASEERRRLEDQLRHADRLATIGRLAAGVAHELNEPLGAILGFAQLTQKGFGIPDQTGRDLEKIVSAALRAREIVKKLLIFARQTPAERAPCDLNRVAREGLYFLTGRCAKAGVQIRLDLAPGLPLLQGDAGLLQQAVLNLALNGVQAMPGGGTLTVSTAAADGELRLAVADTGQGMSEEVRRHIFTPFFTTKEVGQGTGLGLAVVHGIVAGHGGRVEVDSSPGEGSRFVLHFPQSGRAGSAEGQGHGA